MTARFPNVADPYLEHASRLVSLDVRQRPLVTTAMMGPGAGPGDGTEKTKGQT